MMMSISSASAAPLEGQRPAQDLRRRAQAAQRRAHLVRHAGRDLAEEGESGGGQEVVLRPLQIAHHDVEGAGELADLVARAHRHRTPGLAHPGDLLRGLRELAQRPAHALGEQNRDPEGHQQHRGQRQQQLVLHPVQRRQRLAPGLGDEHRPGRPRGVQAGIADQDAGSLLAREAGTLRHAPLRRPPADVAQVHPLQLERHTVRRLRDHQPGLVEHQDVDADAEGEQVLLETLDQGGAALPPVVDAEQHAERVARSVGVVDRRGDQQDRPLVGRPGHGPGQVGLAAQRRPIPRAVLAPFSHQPGLAGSDHPSVRVDAEQVDVARPAFLQRSEEAGNALVDVADDDFAHHLLSRPHPHVAPLARQRLLEDTGRVVRHLRQLAAGGVLDHPARADEGDQRHQKPRHEDQEEREQQQLRAQCMERGSETGHLQVREASRTVPPAS